MNLKYVCRTIVVAVLWVTAIQFSPWVLEQNKIDPYFLGLPFTLWFGILISLIVVLLTALGGSVFSRLKEDELKEE